MSAMSNSLETDFLNLYFLNTDMANVGDAPGLQNSATAGSLYISLHTASPGEAGSQTTSESAYTSYARVAVARSGAGWTISGNNSTNAAEIAFPACTGGTSDVKFFGIGRSSSGAGTLDWYGPLTPARFGFTYDIVDAATDKLFVPGHDFVSTTGLNQIVFSSVQGATLPTGITEGTIYFVSTVNTPNAGDLVISATDGGGALNITSSGAGFVSKIVPLAVSNGITPRFAAGALDVYLD